MRWRFHPGDEPFTFFINYRAGSVCQTNTYDVCVWFPGGRLDVSPTIAHLGVAFLLQAGVMALARRNPGSRLLRILSVGLVPAVGLLKEINDGFHLHVIAGIPVGGSGFSFGDLGFTLLGQLLCVALAWWWRALPARAGAPPEG